jgi:hypothetical protein
MSSKRRALVASTLLGASVILGSAGTAAAELLTINIPAPVAQAEGVGLQVGDLVAVGHTDSQAAPDAGTAVANAVEIGGQAPLAVLGSTQNGPGQTTNALLDTGQTGLGRVEAAPSSATVTENGNSTTSESNAALGRGNLFNPDFASISILESTSTATHEGLLSRAFSTSDALVLNLGGADGTTLRLLHSESASSGVGLTYIIAINDKPIVSVTELTDQICSLPLPEAIKVSCVDVTGGVGSLTSQVLEATVGGANGLTATAVKASGSGGAGATQTISTPAAAPAPAEVQGVTYKAADNSRGLAATGMRVAFLSLIAFAMLALGMVLVGMRRVTTTTA